MLKVLICFKGKPILKPAHASSINEIKIAKIGKESVPISIIDIAPANALIHSKSALFEHLVWTVSTLKGLHNASELIHFMSQELLVDNSSTLQEVQSLSTSIQKWVVGVAALEPQAFLDGNMDESTTYMNN